MIKIIVRELRTVEFHTPISHTTSNPTRVRRKEWKERRIELIGFSFITIIGKLLSSVFDDLDDELRISIDTD